MGLASWYGPGFHGQLTASGEVYDKYGYTAAHKTLPLGTQLVVSYGGSSVEVTVNDRGPYVGRRVIDLSQGAADQIGLTGAGVDYVRYSRVGSGYRAAYRDGYGGVGRYEAEQVAYSADGGYAAVDSGGGGGAYVVQAGDTLSGISAELGTSVEYLAATNGIANPDLVYAGQTLYY